MTYRILGFIALTLCLSAGAQEPPDLDTIRQMAERGERVRALDELDRVVASDPNDIQAGFLRGLLLFEAGDLRAAQEAFTEIARRFPRLPEAYNNLAAIYAAEGEYEKARGALLSAAGNAPGYADVHANLGDLYVKMATDAYREAVELDPSDQVSAAKLQALERLFEEGS